MQMALQQSRTRSSLADQELGQAALAAQQIEQARAGGKTAAAQLRQRAQDTLAADPKAKKQAETLEAHAAALETVADRAAAIVKIARGRGDTLTTAEKNALGDAVVNEGQGMIITDAAREELAQIAPAAARYVKQTETMRREQLSRDQAQTAGAAAPASTPATAPTAANPPPAASPARGTSTNAGGAPSVTGAVTAQGAATAPPAAAAPAVAPSSTPTDTPEIQKARIKLAEATARRKEAFTNGGVISVPLSEAEDEAKKELDALLSAVTAPAPAAQPAAKPAVWKGVGISGKTAEIPADEAATQDEAEKKLIKKLGEPLRSGGVTSPTKAKGAPAAKPTASAPAAAPADKKREHAAKVRALIDATLPAYRDAFTGTMEETGKGARAWLDTKTGALHLNYQSFAAQTFDLDDAALAAEVEAIIRHEWIHAGTVAVRNDAQAAAFWEQLGKSKAGKDIQAAALRAYNAPYEARGVVPPALSDAKSGYEAYRMIYELARDGKLTETTNIPESLADDIRAFLQGLVDWMRARLAKLPKKLRSQIEADISEIEGALKKLTPAAPAAKASKPAPVNAADTTQSLTIVRLKDGRLVHVHEKELAKSSARLRMFTPEGEPIKGAAGVLERSDIDLSPIEQSGSNVAAPEKSEIEQKASAIYQDILNEHPKPTGKPSEWHDQLAIQVENPNRFHRVVEEANDKGIRIGDTVSIGSDSNLRVVSVGQQGSKMMVKIAPSKPGTYGGWYDISKVTKGDTSAPTVDAAAHEAATSPNNDKAHPTPDEIKAGNYEKGHFTLGGMDISIENPAGSERSGIDKDGKKWTVPMKSHYGYIKGTEGKDGDHIDIFIAEGTPKDYDGPVFVVNQMRPVTLVQSDIRTGKKTEVPAGKEFDEHKAVTGTGITTEAEAKAAYLANYSEGWDGAGSIVSFANLAAFKSWAMGKKRVGALTQSAADSHSRAASAEAGEAKQAPLPAEQIAKLTDANKQLSRWSSNNNASARHQIAINKYASGAWTLQDTPSPEKTLADIEQETAKARTAWIVTHMGYINQKNDALVQALAADPKVVAIATNENNDAMNMRVYLADRIKAQMVKDLKANLSGDSRFGLYYDFTQERIKSADWLDHIAESLKKAIKPAVSNDTSAPTFERGDRVTWTSGKESLSGTIRSVSSDGTASVDTDQISFAGGVPIGRIETVQMSRLSKEGEAKPAPKPKAEPAPAPAPKDAADEALAQAFEGLFAADRPIVDPVVQALRVLSQNDEFFRFSIVPQDVKSLTEIMQRVVPGSTYKGDATRNNEPDLTEAYSRQMFATKSGAPFFVFQGYHDGEKTTWIDVSGLKEGGGGSAIYAAVGNYAYNNGLKFIGDPAGLSEAAVMRRTSHLLSLALRYGTTKHIAPSREQLDGVPEKGIAPVRWDGDDTAKIRSLIESFLGTLQKRYPEILNARYDFDAGQFLDSQGMPIRFDRAKKPAIEAGDENSAEMGIEARKSGARAGEATLRRGIFLKSLVSGEGRERSELLEQLELWNRAYVTSGNLDGLFAADRPVADIEQADLPKDRRAAMLNAAGALIDAEVKRPDELAARLEKLAPGGQLRKYSRSFWRLMSGFDSTLAENPDWNAIYDAIDNPTTEKDTLTDETQTDIRPQDSEGLPPVGGSDGSNGLGIPEPDQAGASGRSAQGGVNSGEGGDSPPVGESDGGPSLGDGKKPSKRNRTPRGGKGSSADANPIDGGAAGAVDEPTRSPGRENYFLSDPESIVGGGQKTRFNKNKLALETLELIQEEGRDPTPAELDILAAYTGWGSLAQELFQGGTFERHAGPQDWKDESMWLRERLGKEAWMSAFDSILNAHYTDPPTVKAMWDMVRRLGFKGGRALEPSEGIGNFWGLMPRDMMALSMLTGIEMDSTTAAIAKMLYPQVNHRLMPYQQSQTSDNFYDLVIGNWPFSANDKPADPRFDHLKATVHNFFFVKALHQTRPGGLVIGITSSKTMDGKSSLVRKYLAARGELVAAFRLPTGAFGKYAGTKVVTDIIILKKRETVLERDAGGEGWINTVRDTAGRDFDINEYFVANPQNILGELDFGHGTTFNREGMIVNRLPNYEQVLPRLFERLPENVMTPWNPVGHERIINNTTKERRQGAAVFANDDLYVVDGESLVPLQDRAKWQTKTGTAKRLAEGVSLIAMRDAFNAVLDANRQGSDGETQRKALQEAYASFVKDHGPLHKSFMLGRFRKAGDQNAIDLLALVEVDETTGAEKPRSLMLRNTMRRTQLDAKGSIADAYALHRSETLDFDAAAVAKLAGDDTSPNDVIAFLQEKGLVFKMPDGRWMPNEIYLAGNVRRKLREAIAAKEDGVEGMDVNIDALTSIIPEDIPYHKITVQMGAAWIPTSDYEQFITELLGGNAADVQVVKGMSGYNVRIGGRTADSRDARQTWNVVTEAGQSLLHPSRMFQAAMNGTELIIKREVEDENGNKREEVDEPATRRAIAMRDSIRDRLQMWVWTDESRIARLTLDYNEMKNSVINPEFDGSHLRLPGLSLTLSDSGDPFEFRQHQVNAVWRGILQKQGVYAHEVGTGKTFTMAGLAIEGRRLGSHRKPIIFAHNANAASVAADFRLAYPGAKILFVDNLSPSTKELTLRQIATDEWDAIIVPHSLVDRFGLRPETMRALAQPELDRIESEFWAELDELGVDSSSIDLDDMRGMGQILNRLKGSATAKELANARRRIMTRIEKQVAKFSGPGVVYFEDMGIDAVIVDEAHVFKKISLATRKVIKGLNKTESGKGFQLGLLTDWLKTQTGGKGVHLFTGTPVTNTLNEVFNMMRFAMDKEMGESGIDNFDDWYNDYADGFSDTEPTSGGTYEEVTRLRGFLNVPELARLAGQAFDVVRADEMPEFKPRASHEGITEKPIGRPHKQVRPIVIEPTSVAKRLKAWIRQRFFYYRGLSGRERMFLKKMGGDQPVVMDGDGKAGALDPRFVSPTAEDDANSKVNYAVRNIVEHYNEHDLATQMVFVERGAGDYTEADVAVRDAEGKPQYDNDGNRVEVKERRLQFNLLRDMVEKLVAEGVKPEEIAVFQNLKLLPLPDGKDDILLRVHRVNGPEDKEEAAKLMREGKIRIAFGGTETMGTGVNAQTWMRAMHHLDVPYMPGELEQRNGRGWRQGNKWNTVFEYRYTVEGSHDAKMWSTLLNKVRFIERFIGMLQGKNLSRNLEGDGADAADDEDGMSNADFEQMFSTAAGDPRLILRLSLGKKVDRIQQAKNMHLQFMEQTRRKNAAIENNEIPRLEAAVRQFEKGDELYQQVAGKPFSATLRGETYTERKDFDEAMTRLPRYLDRKEIGTYGPFRIYIQPTMGGGYYELSGPDNFNASFMNPSMASLEGTLRAMKKKAEGKAEEIATLQKSLVRAKDEMSRPFPKEEELTKAQNALAVIESEIRISPYPAPGWLRVGAPQGSLMYLKEKGKLNAYDVEAHRWDENNYWAMISRDGELFPIPYNEMLDATGARIFEDHDHTAPPEAPPTTADGQQGSFPGVEVGLDAEFGYRTLIDRVTGERSIEHKFYTRYATVADGFYNAAAGGGRLPANAADYLPKTVEELQRLLVRSGAASGLFNGKDWKFLAPGESDELYKPTETWRVFAPGGWMVGEGASPREAFFEARNHDQNGDTFMDAIRYAVMQLPESEDDINELLRIASQLPSGIEFQMIDPGLDDPFESENDDTNVFRLTSDGYGILGSGERRAFALRDALTHERFGRTFKEALAIYNAPPAKNPLERLADESRLLDTDRRSRGLFRRRAKLRKLLDVIERRRAEVESNEDRYRNRDAQDETLQSLIAREKALTEKLAEVESFIIYRERTEEPLPLAAADRPMMDAEEFADALDALNSDMPSESDLDDLRQRAGLDWGREYTDSELAGLSGGMRAGMRTAYDDKLDRQTHEAWNEKAHKLIDEDPTRVLADLVSTATDRGSIINPVQVKASQILLPQLMREAIANRDAKSFRMAETLTWAYDAAGTETARGLAARWQPHLSPEERHREVLAKIIFTPGAKDREDIKRAPTDRAQAERIASLEKEIERVRSEATEREKDMLRQVAGMTESLREARRKDAVALRAEAKKELDALRAELKRVQAQKTQLQMLHDINTERLAKIEKAFEEMGITYHDIFVSREISIGLKTSSVVKNAMQPFTPKERQALQMMMDGRSDRQIANKTGISRNSMAGIEARFDKVLDAKLEALVRRGFDISKADGLDVDKLIDKAGNILAAADRPVATLTAEEVKKRVGELRAIIKPSPDARNSGALRRLKGEESKEAPYGFDISRPEHAAMLMRAIHRMDSNPMDMVYEYWINGLLSGPATHTANIAGNLGSAGLEYLIQRPIEAITNAVLFQNVAGASLGEYQSMTKYAARAASTAWRFARIAWNTEVSLFDSQWLNKPLVVSGNSGDKGQLERFAIPGTTGRVVRTPTRFLQFADEWAKHFFGMIEAAAQAHRLVKADGLKPGSAEFDDRVEQLVGIPGSPAWLAAVDKAHRLTFTNDLPAPLAKAQEMLHSRAKTPWGAVAKTLLRFVFPFIRTPYNIFATGLRKTPLGSARMIGKGLAAWHGKQPFFDSYPQAALATDIAEQLLGWSAAMILFAIGEGDPDDEKKTILITGSRSRSDDRGEDQLLDRLRGGETTILIKGKPVFNYGRYEPFATIISTLVDASRDMKKIKGGQKPSKAIGEAVRGVLDQARTKTFLQGLDGLMQLIEGRTSTTMPEQLRKFIVTGIVPNLVRQPIRNADEFARDTRNAPWYYHAIPLGGLAEPLYDLYGRPVEKMGNPVTRAFINTPVQPSTPTNPADRALRVWNDRNPLRGDGDGMGYFPTNVDKSMMRFKDASKKWQDMTPREAAELRRKGGQIMDAEARAAITNPTNPTQDDIDRLKKARNKAFSKAKSEMFSGGVRPVLPARRPPSLSEIFGQVLRR
jgi:N12 class adenine-specific DNA methylase